MQKMVAIVVAMAVAGVAAVVIFSINNQYRVKTQFWPFPHHLRGL